MAGGKDETYDYLFKGTSAWERERRGGREREGRKMENETGTS
jgi:hypothetical protein